MATRQVVTSQPDIACDICGRRLLRGEQPELFLAGAEHRTVCELCSPRATHEGWLRAIDGGLSGHGARRSRRGRTLLDRLRGLREPAGQGPQRSTADRLSSEPAPEPFEFLNATSTTASLLEQPIAEEEHDPYRAGADEHHAAIEDRSVQGLALKAFNTSEGPRRIAGVARALGAPEVSVRSHESNEACVSIVVAWELCWYRYEVDLDQTPASVELTERGIELEQLGAEDRLGNATADERGELGVI